jgi:hypothetical protein
MNRIHKNWLIIGGGGLATLVLAALIVVAVIFFVTQGTGGGTPSWASPLDKIDTKEVKPINALPVLAGESEEIVIQDALTGGDIETAFATAVYSTDLSDLRRLGLLLQVAQAYAKANKADKARLCYERAGDIVTLGPQLNDYVRANAYVQIGQGFRTVGDAGRAKAYYDKAYVVVAFSPTLRPENRSVILSDLAHEYTAVGDKSKAARLTWESQAPSFTESREAPEQFTGARMGPMPQSAALDAAVKKRQAAARDLITALGESRAVADRQKTLEEALIEENVARLEFYDAQLASASNSVGTKVLVSRAKLGWLTLKWRIARRGFGMSLVTDWENHEKDIAATLGGTLEDFSLTANDLVVAAPTQVEAAQGEVDLLRGLILWGRLGLHPKFVEQGFVSDLRKSTSELVTLRSGRTLYVDVLTTRDPYEYVLTSAELYGRSQAPAPIAYATSLARATQIASLPTPTSPPAPTMEPPQVTAFKPSPTPEVPVATPTMAAPPTPTATSAPVATPTMAATPTPSATPTTATTPTRTPTQTPTQTPTRTPSPTSKYTPTPRKPTATPTPSKDVIVVKIDGPIGYPAGANACNKIYGHVLDKDGKPMNGITVRAFNASTSVPPDTTGPRPGQSRDDGYFEFCLERGGWSIIVDIPGKSSENAWVAFDDPNFIGHVEWNITFKVVR